MNNFNWLEEVFIEYGFEDWFQERRLQFLTEEFEFDESIRPIVEITLESCKNGKKEFSTWDEFWTLTLDFITNRRD